MSLYPLHHAVDTFRLLLKWVDYTPDHCIGNLVKENTINTNGIEYVDIKEGSTGSIVEDNSCTNQRNESSSCYTSAETKTPSGTTKTPESSSSKHHLQFFSQPYVIM